MRAYVERHVDDSGMPIVRAWSFDLAHWGSVGVGSDLDSAVDDLHRWTSAGEITVVEDIEGADVAFARDLEAATPSERVVTLAIAKHARQGTLALLDDAEPWMLDRPVADAGAHGEALRIMGLSVATTAELLRRLVELESVTVPSRLGLPVFADTEVEAHERTVDALGAVRRALAESHAHVTATTAALPPRLIRATPDGGEWSSVKFLRTLAWRERSLAALIAALLSD